MTSTAPVGRRAISRELSRIANASVHDVLQMPRAEGASCHRIGITGPPGAGKSTLIASLVRVRLARPGNLAVVAIDPTSPVSGGAILGDRIRMEELATDPRVYIRSLASRGSHDGLADNLPDILEVFARAGFAELVVETVGVGQVEYEIHGLVDTTVLVLMPGAGDQVQAMKSGSIERADIVVVNKSDQPGAKQVASDMASVLGRKTADVADWQTPILLTSNADRDSFERLGAEIDRHRDWLKASGTDAVRVAERRRRHAASLIRRRLDEVMRLSPKRDAGLSVADIFAAAVRDLGSVESA